MSDSIHFRRLTEDDLPLLTEWLDRPHVAEWWDHLTFAQVRAKYLPRLADDSTVVPYLAYVGGRPIGYIQSYVPALETDGWWPDEHDPGVRGIDQFLADAPNLNTGLGTAMVKAFVETLFVDSAVTRVQTDPSPTNARAIRCYEKAGFRQIGLVDTPDGKALLMAVERCEWTLNESAHATAERRPH